MIELSGYTGKSSECVKRRLVAASEMASRNMVSKKFHVKYSAQTLIMGPGFSIIDEGFEPPCQLEADTNSISDFEEKILKLVKEKHRSPDTTVSDGKYIIFSKLPDRKFFVDIVQFSKDY